MRTLATILHDLRQIPPRDSAFRSQREQLQSELRIAYDQYTQWKLHSGWTCVHQRGMFVVYDARYEPITSDELECNAWAKAQAKERQAA